jgi:hypothetical protein
MLYLESCCLVMNVVDNSQVCTITDFFFLFPVYTAVAP